MVLSANSEYLLTGNSNGYACLLETASGQPLVFFKLQRAICTALLRETTTTRAIIVEQTDCYWVPPEAALGAQTCKHLLRCCRAQHAFLAIEWSLSLYVHCITNHVSLK